MHTHLTKKSSNPKTGPIPVSTTEDKSCPPSCPLNDGTCYAKHGHLAMHWKKVSEKLRGESFKQFIQEVEAMATGTFWRHNQAGDLAGSGDWIDGRKLKSLVKANKNKRGFTYTHKHKIKKNHAKIKHANDNGFTVNLSADSLDHADELQSLGIGPVVVIVPADQAYNHTITTRAGNKVNVCPATYQDNVTCKSCQLCQHAGRSNMVGFPAHGTGKGNIT